MKTRSETLQLIMHCKCPMHLTSICFSFFHSMIILFCLLLLSPILPSSSSLSIKNSPEIIHSTIAIIWYGNWICNRWFDWIVPIEHYITSKYWRIAATLMVTKTYPNTYMNTTIYLKMLHPLEWYVSIVHFHQLLNHQKATLFFWWIASIKTNTTIDFVVCVSSRECTMCAMLYFTILLNSISFFFNILLR